MASIGLDPETIAEHVGAQGVDSLVVHAERVCACESERIALSNQGTITGLLEEHSQLLEEERRLGELLQSAPPSGDLSRLRRRAIFCWTLTIVLAASGFALTLMTLAPFRLGSKAWLYSIGVSLLAPFLVDQVLEQWPGLVKVLTPFAAAAGVSGLMLFAVIRGDLLGQEMRQNDTSAVVIDNAEPQQTPRNDFYALTVPLIRLAMLLLAFSIEVGSGIALREARRSGPNSSEDWGALRRELRDVRQRKSGTMRAAVDLHNEPAIFAAQFRRDFYRAMLSNAVRSAMTKLLLVMIGIAFVASSNAHGQARQDFVVAIDLTASVSTTGPDGTSEFQKDIDGVTRLLSQIPAGSRVTVIGITDRSFAQPYILLSARTDADGGYFGERLATARSRLVNAWKQRSVHLDTHFRSTDILGTLQLASQIFAQQSDSAGKTLVLFSDMRQNTPELNLESPSLAPSFPGAAGRCAPIPALKDVHVVILGADGAGRSSRYWQSLQSFWQDYFRMAGAELRTYSALRESQFALEVR